jgi:integral membrane sensor domain MASE1
MDFGLKSPAMALHGSSEIGDASGADDPWLPAAAIMPTFLLAYGTLLLACETRRIAVFWPADAVAVALLLHIPMKAWWRGLLAGFTGLVCARLLIGCTPLTALVFSTINLMEVLTCAGLIRWATPHILDLKRPSHLGLFLIAAGLVAPLASAITASGLLAHVRGIPFWPTLTSWYEGDALGLLISTPAILAMARSLRQGWKRAGIGR